MQSPVERATDNASDAPVARDSSPDSQSLIESVSDDAAEPPVASDASKDSELPVEVVIDRDAKLFDSFDEKGDTQDAAAAAAPLGLSSEEGPAASVAREGAHAASGEQHMPDTDQGALASGGGAVAASSFSGGRAIGMALLVVAVIALLLVLKAWFVAEDESQVAGLAPKAAVLDRGSMSKKEAATEGATKPSVEKAAAAQTLLAKPKSPPTPKNKDTAHSVAGGQALERSASPSVPAEAAAVVAGPERVMVSKPVKPKKANAKVRGELQPVVVAPNLRRPVPSVSAEGVDAVEAASDGGDGAVAAASAAEQEQTILISFSFDSDDLIPDAYLALDEAAALLRENTSNVASITGFTDKFGDSQYNLVLSRKRANAVKRYLVDAGIAGDRLRVEGRGVLNNPLSGSSPEADDTSMEPYRVVQIKLSREG